MFHRYCRSLVASLLLMTAAATVHARTSVSPSPVFTSRSATALDTKMDAPLRMLIERAQLASTGASSRATARSLESLRRPSSPFTVLPDQSGEGLETFVFARLDELTGPAQVAGAGGSIVLQKGDLAIVRAPIARLQALAALGAVRSLSLSTQWHAGLDSSRVRSKASTVQGGGGGLPQAYKGAGVVVGVLDSGIDYTHADFRTAGNLSRLRGLLDFSAGVDGTECRPGQLDSLTCPEIDGSGSHGHGTHVTGIAAGGGRRNPAFVGMAPEADIVFVKGIRDAQSNGGFSDADVVNGTAFILEKAAQLGKPAVVNLSLGGDIGAHDGTSLQEQFLDRFVGPGRIIVAAAGNSGGEAVHGGYLVQGTDFAGALETGMALTGPQGVVDFWAPAGSNISVGVAAYDPSDVTTPLFVAPRPLPALCSRPPPLRAR